MNRFLPLLLFLPLIGIMVAGLKLNPHEVPSPLINRQAPAFVLPQLHKMAQSVSPESLKGRVWLLNVWASWCVSCRAEHPLLLSMRDKVALVGLNYKDRPAAAQAWLARWGDPYLFSAVDADGAAGLDWGVYGVPETFVIDADGVVRYKHIGALDEAAIEETILPLVRRLREGAI